MPVELRKRKAPLPPPAPAPPLKKTSRVNGADKAASKAKVGVKAKAKAKAAASKKKEEDDETEEEEKAVVPQPEKDASPPAAAADTDAASPAAAKKVAVGDVIDLDGFGGEIEINDGKKTTLKELVEESGSGVVVFTYPKASTPGCKSYMNFILILFTCQARRTRNRRKKQRSPRNGKRRVINQRLTQCARRRGSRGNECSTLYANCF